MINLDSYVYDCLNRFGNTVLSSSVYKKYGEAKILNHLAREGYVCRIRVAKDLGFRFYSEKVEDSIILELIEKKPYEYQPLVFR